MAMESEPRLESDQCTNYTNYVLCLICDKLFSKHMKNLQLWIIFNYVFNKYFIQQRLFEQLLNFFAILTEMFKTPTSTIDTCDHWRIQGGAPGTRAPPWGSKFFHFHAVFGKNVKNNSNFGSWRPPPGKILDPPLVTDSIFD